MGAITALFAVLYQGVRVAKYPLHVISINHGYIIEVVPHIWRREKTVKVTIIQALLFIQASSSLIKGLA